ncbi:efflux RND transporter periplasmic adaptor subunit [Dysgonomonas sp. ZJ709]|uniref:efflux RND transporter periplasmic adaptor subunit n=1 Tax=Dysgonomonas sp. ZJ709 TaxID=2709797 RepID=UPI0013EAD217|nr:efflux RND transporter periplasmic adaptor subunit [Dysgonomonas sp. ZJ709]
MKNIKTNLSLLSVCIFIFLFSACKKTTVEPPVVEVEPATVDNIEIYGDYVGLIRASRNVEIRARVEGFLEKMTFNEGKKVEVNEPLFYINNAPYKARVEKAKAQLKKDEAQQAKAQRDAERLRPLYQQNAASQLDLDNAEAALDMTKANVAMSRADLEQAELELSYTVVRSPLSGYISERYVDIGTLVGNNAKSLLATVVKRDTVLVDFKLTSLDYLRSQRRNVHLGELDTTRSWQPTVTVTLADNSVYGAKGIVDFASPLVDPKTGTFGVRAELPNPNQVLLPGQFTRVKLLLDVLENVVVVPRKAIIIEKGGAFIFVIRPDSIAEKRYIETGPEQNNKIVVTRGLSANENIVVEGYQKLTHGQLVIPRTRNEEEAIEATVREQQAKKEGKE